MKIIENYQKTSKINDANRKKDDHNDQTIIK